MNQTKKAAKAKSHTYMLCCPKCGRTDYYSRSRKQCAACGSWLLHHARRERIGMWHFALLGKGPKYDVVVGGPRG